jgi:hypothetical protein
MATVTPLDLRRAQTALEKLNPSSPGYQAALDAYNSIKTQLDAQVTTASQARTTEEAASRAKSNAKASKQDTALLTQLQSTLNERYQASVNLGQPDPVIKAQLDKVNTELSGQPTTTTPTTSGSNVSPEVTNQISNVGGSKSGLQTMTPAKSTGPTGPKSTGPKSAGPVVSKGTGSTGSTGGTGSTTSADFMAQYGVQAALINSDPSLKELFNTAMAKGYDAKRFTAEFLNTSWAKNHAETWQNAEKARLSAPGEYANSYNRMRNYLARTAVSMGESISPDQLGAEIKPDANGNYPTVTPSGSDLVQWALSQSWGKGVDSAAIQQHLAEVGKINLALPGGQAASTMSQLKSLANDYGLNSLNVSGSNYFSDAAQSILLGKSTIDTWKQDIINTAKQNYKPYVAQLDAGITLKSIASPYINAISNLLEIPPDTVDLSQSTGYGKMVSNALMGSDPTSPTAMTLSQFEQQVKQDPRWAITNNARDTVMGGVGGLLKMLGKVGA